MPVVKNLMVRAGADFSPISKQAQKAQNSMRGMQQNVGKSCNAMKSAFSGLKKVLGVLGIALSFGAIISAAKSAKEAFDKQSEAEAKLAQVMRNTMGARASDIASIKDLTNAQQELGVVGADVQVAGAQEMATYLGEKASLEKLIPIMNDMIAQQYGYNATQENAVNIATMMGKVMQGQTGALRRYGYTFTQAQEAVLKYGTEAERAAVLAQVIEESVGGMNQALASTPTGRMQQLKNTLDDVKAQFGQAVTTIGTVFLPLLKELAKVLADVATIANKIAQAISNVFGSGKSAQAAIIGYGSTASDAVGEIGEATEEAAASAEKLGTAGFDTLQKLSGGKSDSSASSGSSGGGSGVSTIIEESEEAEESIGWLEAALNRLKQIVEGWDTSKLSQSLERLKEAAQPIVDLLGNTLGWIWENVLIPLGQWTIEEALPASIDNVAASLKLLKAIADKLQPIWQWLWDYVISPAASAIGTVLVDALKGLTIALNDLADWINGTKGFEDLTLVVSIKALWEDTKSAITKKWQELTSGISTKYGKIRAWWGNTKEGVKQRWQSITSGISTKWGKIRAWWGNTKEGVKQRWQSITSGIETKFAKISAWWTDTKAGLEEKWDGLAKGLKERTVNIKAKLVAKWQDIKDDFLALLKPASDYALEIKAKIATSIQGLKDWINTSVIDPLNKKIQGAHVGSWYPLAGVAIPHLAQGGYLRANNPTLAVVGDNRTQGEIVSPEGKLAAMAREAAAAAVRGARYVMGYASDIRTPPDVPSILRALTGPYGAAALNVGGVGDEAMTILRRLLSAVEDGKVLTVDRQSFGRLVRQTNSAYARSSGSVPVAR